MCERVCSFRSGIEVFHRLGPARLHIQHTPGDLGNACLGHVEVCAAVAQSESRSTASSAASLRAQGSQIPGSQASHIKNPPRTPKWDVSPRNFRRTRPKRGATERRTASHCVQSFLSSFRGFGGFYLFIFFERPRIFLSIFWFSHWPPTCRSDDGSSEPRWRWPLLGVCARAAGGCSGTGPVRRSVRAALPDPVLLYRDYSGLSRPRAPQRAQEHTPQRGATVSTKREKALPAQFCSHLRPYNQSIEMINLFLHQ